MQMKAIKFPKAPAFTLPDQDGINRSLDDYRGHWVVLYFYPHDNTLNCIREACRFRDEYQIIGQFGNAKVIAINKGTVGSHKKFSDKHRLNFLLLSDAGHKVTSLYGAWRSNRGKLLDMAFGTRRNTYIIDPAGNIAKTYLGVSPRNHVEMIISDLQSLQAKPITPNPPAVKVQPLPTPPTLETF
jgi:peroxiredoxin Q/BCP